MEYKVCIFLLMTSIYLRSNYASGQHSPAPPNYIQSHTFTTEHGLSQNNVSCIAKDRNGFIWVGTGDGLNRFDGYSFIHFSHSDKDSTSLSNDVIRALLLDSKGRLWVGTYNGLNLYDPDREVFKRFITNPSDENAISQNTILCLLEDKNHYIWVGTYWGLNKIDPETLSITRYYYSTDGNGLADNAVTALLEDRDGKVWVCTGKGINIIGASGIETTIPQNDMPGGLTSRLIIGIAQDSSGAIYLGTNGSGVLRLENEDDRTFEYFTHSSNDFSLGSNILSDVRIDQKGSLIVATDGAGLYRYEGNGTFTQIVSRNNGALKHGSVQKIFIDDENNYWFGLFSAGLTLLPGTPPRFEHYEFFDSTMERLKKNSILAIAEDHNQKIWLGTDGSGLYKFDPETKTFSSYQHSSTNKNSLSTNVVKSLLVDDKNNLLIGTYAGGMNYLDTKTMTFSRFLHDSKTQTSISTNHVWSLLQDRSKRIYVGQLGGLDEFLPQSNTFRGLTIEGQNPVTSNTASVFRMQEDRHGNIWMGTRLAGVHRYDPKNRSFTSFLHTPLDSAGFPSNEIVELGMDSKGRILVGTDDKGLIRFDPDSLIFHGLAPGYHEKNVASVLEDDFHYLWFTSFDGLHRYNPEDGEIYNYTVADGLQGVQFNEGSRLKSSTGIFYFGGTNGLNVFDPEKIREDYSKPSVVFTELSLFHDIVRVNDATGLLKESIAKTKVLTFAPDQNVFSIEFACLEYKFPKTNRYRYILEGFDHTWNDIHGNRTATYTNLPPGGYTLKVSATNSNGYWNEEAATMKIIVTPRWHQRLAARIGFVALLLVATFGIVYTRTRFLLNQKRKLEHLVAVRTKLIETQKGEIKDKNEKLEQAYEEVNAVNEELQQVNANLEELVEKRTKELRRTIKKLIETDEGLNTFLYRSSHDLRGPITSLLGLSQVAKMQNEQDQLSPYFANIEHTAVSMLRLLKRLTETAALFRANRQIKTIRVEEFIESVLDELKKINCQDAVRIEVENRIGDTFKGDPVLLHHIVVNLMENGIVFKGEVSPFVKCILSVENHFIVIQVVDNGKGVDPQMKEKIFEMFYRGSEKSMGNGLGLFMVKKALEILEGSITIESEPDVRTVFTVKAPMEV